MVLMRTKELRMSKTNLINYFIKVKMSSAEVFELVSCEKGTRQTIISLLT